MRVSQWESGKTNLDSKEGNPDPKKLRLSIPDAIEQVIENNTIVQNAKLEIVKADSPEYKNESKFVWRALAGIQVSKQYFPNNRNNVFQGTIRSQDKISAGIEKQFSTGTYFKTEVSTIRMDTNAFENNSDPSTAAFGSLLAAPPMYTGALSLTLSQELLKYGFGTTEADKEKLLKNQTLLVRENYIGILTQLVVKILVDYWSLSIIDSQIATYERVLKNTEEIRNLTRRKTGLGLSEGFEVNQWNQAYLKTESMLEKAKVDRLEAERNLIRILNVDTSSSIEGVTDLSESLPLGLDTKRDKEYALTHRTDYLILKRELEITKLMLKTAKAEEDPSVKASLSYSSVGQNFLSPQENYIARQRGITSFKYPQYFAELSMSYPLWDLGVKAAIKEAETNAKVTELKIQNLEQQIGQEIEIRYEAIQSSYNLLKDLQKTKKETEIFYNGLLSRFKQGRYTAVNVKNALDSLAQAELGVTQAKINFNINLVRYEMTKNSLFEKYGVDIYAILDEVEKRAKAESDKL
ncbi:TolC family protein [Leptospira sp. 96542]|nr:TolC family protein [Leptospira sp. 96542]